MTGRNEIICDNPENIWICQLSSKGESKSFSEFIDSILSANTKFDGMNVNLQTTNGDIINTGYNKPLVVNSNKVETSDYKRIENQFIVSEYKSGKYEISDGIDKIIVNFDV